MAQPQTYDRPRFIKLWRQARSVGEVARRMRCTNGAARLRACYLRKIGFKLKHMPKGRKVA